jgi:hypothetical protein
VGNVNGLQGALDSKATNNATNNANITFTGTITGGAVVDNSDESLKENVEPMQLADAWNIVHGTAAGVSRYYHKRAKKDQFGVIAQRQIDVTPELVFEGTDGKLGVQYQLLSAPLTLVASDLDERLAEIEKRLGVR